MSDRIKIKQDIKTLSTWKANLEVTFVFYFSYILGKNPHL